MDVVACDMAHMTPDGLRTGGMRSAGRSEMDPDTAFPQPGNSVRRPVVGNVAGNDVRPACPREMAL